MMGEMNSHSPSIGQIFFCVYLKPAVQPSALPFIPHACSAAPTLNMASLCL